jgi:magnesium transporter
MDRQELVARIRALIHSELRGTHGKAPGPGGGAAGSISAPGINGARGLEASGEGSPLRRLLSEAHPAAVAEAIEPLDAETAVGVLGMMPETERALTLAEVPGSRQLDLAERLGIERLAPIVDRMPHDDRADLLNRLDTDLRHRLLAALTPTERADAERLASYPEGTVGSVMTSDYASVPSGLNLARAMAHLREQASDRETISYVYIVKGPRLVGVVSLRQLILGDPLALVDDLMTTDLVAVAVDRPKREAADLLQRYDLVAVPVVDAEQRLAGIVTFDDVLDVVQEQATGEFHKVGGSGLLKVSLREAGVWLLIRKRLPWLLGLVFFNIFSGAGIAAFEETLDAMISLAFFLPLLIDSGGNAGSQSATLMIRALATGDVQSRDWLRLFAKEIGVALSLGLAMACAVSLVAAFRAPEILVVVAMTMVLIVLVGSLIGMLLPFLLTRLGRDPATASAPLITSLADIFGVLIYFSIATWWLGATIRAAAETGAP